MPVIVIYSNYISKLLCINDLYCITMKYVSKKYNSKGLLTEHYKDKNLMD